MSDETIREGDLVVIVKPVQCCGSQDNLGQIFTVQRIFMSKQNRCRACGGISARNVLVAVQQETMPPLARSLYRLRRIPPLSELETTNTDSEVTA